MHQNTRALWCYSIEEHLEILRKVVADPGWSFILGIRLRVVLSCACERLVHRLLPRTSKTYDHHIMSHANTNTSSMRNLSLTEELEKLEQSITLTLQGQLPKSPSTLFMRTHEQSEIDHNFSRAHRIVTTSILPIVDQYAEHSKAVWEGSKVYTSHLAGDNY